MISIFKSVLRAKTIIFLKDASTNVSMVALDPNNGDHIEHWHAIFCYFDKKFRRMSTVKFIFFL